MIQLHVHIYIWKKVILFCFVVMRSIESRWFRSCSWCLWKALNKQGCMGLVPWRLDLQCKSSWMIFSLKNELNCSWNFWGIGMWKISKIFHIQFKNWIQINGFKYLTKTPKMVYWVLISNSTRVWSFSTSKALMFSWKVVVTSATTLMC